MIKKYVIFIFRQISAVGLNEKTAGNNDTCLLDGDVGEEINFR